MAEDDHSFSKRPSRPMLRSPSPLKTQSSGLQTVRHQSQPAQRQVGSCEDDDQEEVQARGSQQGQQPAAASPKQSYAQAASGVKKLSLSLSSPVSVFSDHHLQSSLVCHQS